MEALRSSGLTEEQAQERYECAVATVRCDDLLLRVADAPEGFCKLIVEARCYILGAHVLGEHSVEVIQIVACMARIMQRDAHRASGGAAVGLLDLHETIGLAARQLIRELGVMSLAPAVGDSGPLYI